MRITVSYCLQHGKNKKECEDSALIGHQVINEESGTVELQAPCWVCICDGVGGNAGGKEASMFVAQELSKADIPHNIEDIKTIFNDVNNSLNKQAKATEDHKKMATTATALFISDDSFYMAHVGDTRLYAMHETSISQISVDQTLYQWFIDHGLKIFAKGRIKEVIYGAMGGGREKNIKTLVVKQLPENLISSSFLMTSDGIHDSLSQDEIEDILKSDASMSDKAKMLCSTALGHESKDDRSAIIICIENNHA